jgi:phosphatidylglycerol:prolipoprotein diacylglycerol transferase
MAKEQKFMPCELGLQPGICIGPLPIRFYGMIIVLGALVGGFIASREARRRGENPDRIWDALVWVVVAGIIGARLYHVFSTPAGCNASVPSCGWPWYQNHPIDALFIWNGGLGIFGAVLAGAIVVLIYVRRNHLSLAKYLDIAAPALLIGQAIGRWGNFANQELYGPPTTLPWGIPIDAPHRYGEYVDLTKYPVDTTRFHPDFLYESVLNTIGFILLIAISRRFKDRLKDGDLILLYMIWYPAVRIFVESLRPDAWTVVGGLPTAQLISIVLIVAAIILLLVRHRPQRSTPAAA